MQISRRAPDAAEIRSERDRWTTSAASSRKTNTNYTVLCDNSTIIIIIIINATRLLFRVLSLAPRRCRLDVGTLWFLPAANAHFLGIFLFLNRKNRFKTPFFFYRNGKVELCSVPATKNPDDLSVQLIVAFHFGLLILLIVFQLLKKTNKNALIKCAKEDETRMRNAKEMTQVPTRHLRAAIGWFSLVKLQMPRMQNESLSAFCNVQYA